MTLAIEEANDADLALTKADEDSLAAQNTDETPVDVALCADGLPFAACAKSLPFMLWLRQYWRFQDMSSRLHLTPWERAKTQIFASALGYRGITPSRLHSRCESE